MAYEFNGSNQSLRVGSPIITGFPFTMAARARIDDIGSVRILVCPCASGANEPYYYLATRNTGVATAGFSFATIGANINGATSLTAGSSYSFAGRFESASVTVFLDGLSDGSVSHSVAFDSGTNRLGIGILDRPTPLLFADGTISEVAIWNAALTDAEILSLARGFTPDQIRPQSLGFYAPLVRDLQDVRGGRAITNVNSATVATHPRIIT